MGTRFGRYRFLIVSAHRTSLGDVDARQDEREHALDVSCNCRRRHPTHILASTRCRHPSRRRPLRLRLLDARRASLRTAFASAFSAARAREGHRRSPHRTSGHMPPRVSRCKGGNIGDSRGCHISATRSSTAAAARSRCPAMCLLCRTTPKCQRCSPQHRCTKRFIRPSRPVCSNQYLYRRMMASVVACEWHA